MTKTSIIACAVSVLLGLVMLFVPNGFVSALLVGIGIAAVINGIVNLLSLRNLIDDASFRRAILIRGILNIIAGLAAIIIPLTVAGTVWTVIIYILAAELIVSAIIELYSVWKLRQAGISAGMFISEALISILIAAVLFAIPAAIGLTIIRILGVLIIIGGISGIVWGIRANQTGKADF
ncbi:DUF308 domain-containing protein [Treponema sp. OttesenSCG-928-L16]|nr:DUF308 domain-containing protein [Treponema sp. OttesenSCG-928-L16]